MRRLLAALAPLAVVWAGCWVALCVLLWANASPVLGLLALAAGVGVPGLMLLARVLDHLDRPRHQLPVAPPPGAAVPPVPPAIRE